MQSVWNVFEQSVFEAIHSYYSKQLNFFNCKNMTWVFLQSALSWYNFYQKVCNNADQRFYNLFAKYLYYQFYFKFYFLIFLFPAVKLILAFNNCYNFLVTLFFSDERDPVTKRKEETIKIVRFLPRIEHKSSRAETSLSSTRFPHYRFSSTIPCVEFTIVYQTFLISFDFNIFQSSPSRRLQFLAVSIFESLLSEIKLINSNFYFIKI